MVIVRVKRVNWMWLLRWMELCLNLRWIHTPYMEGMSGQPRRRGTHLYSDSHIVHSFSLNIIIFTTFLCINSTFFLIFSLSLITLSSLIFPSLTLHFSSLSGFSLELLGFSTYFTAKIPGLSLPLVALVDFMGFRLFAGERQRIFYIYWIFCIYFI